MGGPEAPWLSCRTANGRHYCDGPCGLYSHPSFDVAYYMATESCRGRVKLVIRYPKERRDEVLRLAALVFGHPDVSLLLYPDGVDTVVYVLPNGLVTTDVTRATAALQRILVALKAGGGR